MKRTPIEEEGNDINIREKRTITMYSLKALGLRRKRRQQYKLLMNRKKIHKIPCEGPRTEGFPHGTWSIILIRGVQVGVILG